MLNKIKKVVVGAKNEIVNFYKENPEGAMIGVALGIGAAGYLSGIALECKVNRISTKSASLFKNLYRNCARINFDVDQSMYAIDKIIDKIGETDPEWVKNLDADLANYRKIIEPDLNAIYNFAKVLKV